MKSFLRIRRPFALPAREDVQKELDFHLEMRARELEDRGWDAEEARLEAARLFGDLEGISAECRAITRKHRQKRKRADMFDALRQDLKYGGRTLARNPGFTAVALLTLALGIGATSAIFSVVRGVLLSPLLYPQPENLVTLWEESERGRKMAVSYTNFDDWRTEARSFAGMAVYSGWGATVLGGATPIRTIAVSISEDFFPLLGVEPLVGRVFLAEETRFGGDPAVVISHGFWQALLGGTFDLEEETLRFSGRTYRVVGVMPPGFTFPEKADLWYPQALSKPATSRTAHNWHVVARLAPGVGLETARAEVDAIVTRIRQAHPGDNDAWSAQISALRDELVGEVSRPLTLLLAASGLVLLVAATNLASTLLARAVARRRELAVRAAIGAGRRRVVRQLLTETVLLTTLGGLAGLVLAQVLVRYLIALRPAGLPRLESITVDGGVFFFTLAISILTGLIFGLFPASQAARTDLRSVMSDHGQTTSGSRRGRMWDLLAGTEVALALVLLIGSGLLIKSFRELLSIEPGFTSDDVLTFELAVPGIDLGDAFAFEPYRREEKKMAVFYRDFLDGLEGLPGVERAGLINNLPLSGIDGNGAFVREGQAEEDYSNASYRVVGGDYFQALHIPLLRGRLFDERETGGPHTVLVNETFVARYFPGEDPIGQRLRSFGMDLWWEDWMTVIGVVGDVHHRGLDQDPRPEIYVPLEQRAFRARTSTVTVRAASSAAGLVAPLRAHLRERYPELPLDSTPMSALLARSVEKERFTALLLGSFAALALALAAIGIYSVVSYSVARRTREMGIRIALGAGPWSVVGLVMRDALGVVLVGLATGVGGALVLCRLLQSQLFGTSPTDPVTFFAMAALLALAATVASYIPARRSTGIDPMRAIRDSGP